MNERNSYQKKWVLSRKNDIFLFVCLGFWFILAIWLFLIRVFDNLGDIYYSSGRNLSFMSVPKFRNSRSRVRRRRAHHHLKPVSLRNCGKCSEPVLPHVACKACGFYKGREVVKKDVVPVRVEAKTEESKPTEVVAPQEKAAEKTPA